MQIAETIGVIIAGVVAFAALRLGRSSFKRDHRPIVRPAPLWDQLDEEDPDNYMMTTSLVAKNLGRGPAMSIQVYDNLEKAIIGSKDVLEPLAPGGDESKRIGRTVIGVSELLPKRRESYSIYYQDILGEWHATDFWVRTVSFTSSFRGRVRRHQVPVVVRG